MYSTSLYRCDKFKVQVCTENHVQHFCRNCKMFDSDNFTKNCPQSKIQHCLVPQRQENHLEHVCKICKNKNSDHFSSKCTQNNNNCKVINHFKNFKYLCFNLIE